MKKLIVLIACMLTLTSCLEHLLGNDEKIEGFEHPVTETTDEYTITYQYKEDVIVLTEKAQDFLVKVEADTILYFSSSTPEQFSLKSAKSFHQEFLTNFLMDWETLYLKSPSKTE